MQKLEKYIFTFSTQSALALILELISLVVLSFNHVIPVQIGAAFGVVIFYGWLLSACYFIERRLHRKLVISPIFYIIICAYFILVTLFSFGEEKIHYYLKFLYWIVSVGAFFYFAHLVSLIWNNGGYKILKLVLIFLGITIYPIGIWFIQPKIIRFLREQ